eukprot:gene17279-23826_t
MCCLISGEPTEDPTGRLKVFHGQKFQASMMEAPCAGGCGTMLWFCGQFIPVTCGCTQYALRKKVLGGDMSKYTCFQGYFNLCCCIKAGNCCEKDCPDLCLFCEACICNGAAISASRAYVMDKYQLSSDPCDYRLIRINNCLQMLACVCNILAIFIAELRQLADLINRIADLFYHCVSGCMTSQVAFEVNYQNTAAPPVQVAYPTNESP